MEPGLKIPGVRFQGQGLDIPVYFTSYIDNAQDFKFGIPISNEREKQFLKINGIEAAEPSETGDDHHLLMNLEDQTNFNLRNWLVSR